MADRITLTYMASDAIVDYIAAHPVRWGHGELAKIGGPGDRKTPTPAMAVFFEMFALRGALFSQEEYIDYALSKWPAWLATLSPMEIEGLQVRLGRNFYVSAVDSLHVWAMLVETGAFRSCVIDTALDAVGKTDISVTTSCGSVLSVALSVDSPNGRHAYDHKRKWRGVAKDAIILRLPMDRPRTPGNKRWYNKDDLHPILDAAGVVTDMVPGNRSIPMVKPTRNTKRESVPIGQQQLFHADAA